MYYFSMDYRNALTVKQRARIDVSARAGVFGVQARDNRMLAPTALLLLVILAHAALVVAITGVVIISAASLMRRAGLCWLGQRRVEDLAERNAERDSSAAESNHVMTHAGITAAVVVRTLQLPPPPPAHARSGRSIAAISLTPKLSQRPAQARTIAGCAA